jgi:hypothetical protein
LAVLLQRLRKLAILSAYHLGQLIYREGEGTVRPDGVENGLYTLAPEATGSKANANWLRANNSAPTAKWPGRTKDALFMQEYSTFLQNYFKYTAASKSN